MFNKRYRAAQKVLDIEARQVANSVTEIDGGVAKQAKAGEIDNLLGGMVCIPSLVLLNSWMKAPRELMSWPICSYHFLGIFKSAYLVYFKLLHPVK